MPTVLKCITCEARYYTAANIKKGEKSDCCSKCQGSLISMGFPGYQALNTPYKS